LLSSLAPLTGITSDDSEVNLPTGIEYAISIDPSSKVLLARVLNLSASNF
jgi:hypothetical protein